MLDNLELNSFGHHQQHPTLNQAQLQKMLSPMHKSLPTSQTQQNTQAKQDQQIVQSKIYVWGSINNLNQLRSNSKSGNKRLISASNSTSQNDFDKVEYIYKFKNNAIVNVNCGKNHIAMISKKGELYMLGQNDYGQLGVDSDEFETQIVQPLQISSLYYKGLIIDQVSCGFSHTIAVSKNGKVFSWGYAKFGQLGHQNFDNKSKPTEISFFTSAYQSSKEILQVQCGAHHCGLLDSQGDLYMWGAGELGQLGSTNRFNENKPFLLRKVTQQGEKIKEIALGYYHTLILTDLSRVLQTGISEKALKISQNQNDISTYFCDVACLNNQIEILSIKAKDMSAALNNAGQVMIWASTQYLDVIGGIKDIGSFGDTKTLENIFIHDYELCKDTIIMRSDDKFYKYSMLDQSFVNFEQTLIQSQLRLTINNLTILSCGNQFIIGVESKRKNLSQQSKTTDGSQSFKQSSSKSSSSHTLKNFQESNEKLSNQPLRGVLANKNYALNMNESDNCQSDLQVFNKSYYGGQSTVVKRLSSYQNTRSGSRGEAQLSIYSNENLQAFMQQNQNQANALFKLGQKIENLSQSSMLFNATQNTNNEGLKHIKSVIYDDANEDNASSFSMNQTMRQNTLISYNENNHFKYNDVQSSQIEQENLTSSGKMDIHENISSILGPKSLRISYDELRCGPISDLTTSRRQKESNGEISRSQTPEDESEQLRHRNQLVSFRNIEDNQNYMRHNPQGSEDFANIQSKNALSEKKTGKKEKVKEALHQEIRQRVMIEQQLMKLQQEFDQFKNEVGVDQMKQVLQESQNEYQKLYEICVKECEKSTKYCELYKKEKNLREQRENQIVDFSDQEELLKNQIRHLENQLCLLRDQKDTEQQSLQQTVMDQQKIIEELRELIKIEKESTREKVFDLEEINIQLRQEIQLIHEQNQGQLMIQQQTIHLLSTQNQELKVSMGQLNEKLNKIDQEKGKSENLQKENMSLRQDLSQAQSVLKTKIKIINDYDQLFSQLKQQEQDQNDCQQLLNQQKSQLPSLNDVKNKTLEIEITNNQNNNTSLLAQLQQTTAYTTPLFKNNTTPKQDRNLSQGKTNFIVKKNQSNITSKVECHSNKVVTPKIISQTTKSSALHSNYQSKKQPTLSKQTSNQNTNSKDTKQTLSNQRLNKKASQKSIENSPLKLQQIIQEQDMNTQKFIKDISKIVGNPAISKDLNQSQQNQDNQIQDQQKSAQTNQISSGFNKKKSRSNSPIDYLGYKVKPNTQYQPRLSSSNASGSQTQRLQNRHVHINLAQSRNLVQAILPSPKIINTYDDDYKTPSTYSLNITPVIQSSRGNNMNATFIAQGQRNSIFENDFNTQHYISGNSNSKPQQNLSKSFDGHQSTVSKKQVKFQILTQSCPKPDENSQSQTSFMKEQNQPLISSFIKADDNPIVKDESEIEKLYESLSQDMKSLQGQNVDNLKGKLEQIRKNKSLLEEKIKEYEKKLGK
ncbi:regulator of chromosome condensation [Stylonychia lemnae]|uniref:Regulator of chromosome condensation n=1 Tax=Stylonychia lemnae TaxID=5949 RepID=A0A078A544_STYLE|nr:regulator of chromosome condensation [Stylonychia lemnae]|eukprot:CDW77324.1 regulator of chromosome condensation [Stylonychia lemnae]